MLIANRLRSSASGAVLMAAVALPLNTAAGGEAVDQDGPPERVTITATRTPTPILEVPATVSVITSQQIEENLVTDIKDLVQFEPGVAVRSAPYRISAQASTGRGGNEGFNIRGLEGNRVLILADGIRVPDAFDFGPQAVGRGDYVDLSLLKSVEILRGPASALYGSDGVAGAVSFITKDPGDFLAPDETWHAEATVGASSVDTSWSENVLAAFRSGRWEAMAAYTRRDGHETETQGDNDSANTDRTKANPQDWESNAVLGKIVFTPTDRHRLRLTYDHLDRMVDTDVLSAIAKPPLTNTSTVGFFASDEIDRDRIALDHAFENGMGVIRSANWAAYYQASTTREFSFEDRNVSADRTRISTFDNRAWGANIQAESVAETGMVQHRFIYGGDISFTHQTGLRDGIVPPFGETFPTRAFPTTDYVLAGLFIQDEITAFDGRLSLYPAVRFDFYSLDPKPDELLTIVPEGQDDSHVSPKIGVLFRATPVINVFANYGAGFKAPSPSQVNNAFTNFIANYTSIPNPDLKPETSNTIEGGVRFVGGRWQLGVTGFAGWYEDFIEQVLIGGSFAPTDPGVFQFVNLGSVEISGVELKGEVSFESGFGVIAALSYAYGQAESEAESFPLNSIQPLKLVGGVNYRDPMGRFGAQIVATYSDSKDEDRIDQSICTPSCFAPGSFVILDATGYVNVWGDTFTLRAGVFNLFDEKYWWWSDVAGVSSTSVARDAYTSPGRNFRVSLTARL